MSTEVTDQPDRSHFEVTVDGAQAGFAAYRLRGDDVIVFTHTEIDDAYAGRGLGGILARGALDQVRAAGQRRVVALCPFISAWIKRHPDYQDLLAA
jgi:predicted GNAT family acetyltransferase